MSDDQIALSAVALSGRTYCDLRELLTEAQDCNEAALAISEHSDLPDGLGQGLYFLTIEMRKRLSAIERMLSGGKEAANG